MSGPQTWKQRSLHFRRNIPFYSTSSITTPQEGYETVAKIVEIEALFQQIALSQLLYYKLYYTKIHLVCQPAFR